MAVLTALSALPIVAILLLMIGFRWPAARAGVAGLALALPIALVPFGFGTRVQPQLGAAGAVAGIVVEAAFVALTILWIIFPALCIHHLQERTGGMRALREWLARLTNDPRLIAVLVAWFFALFAEGAAGFGTPVALAAPFLVGLGFGRVEAVTIALLGHCVGVSFGAVGTPVLPQVAVSGFTGLEISGATVVPHLAFGGIMFLFVMRIVGTSEPARHLGLRGATPWFVAAALLFLVPYFAIARWVGPELPTLGGALVGGATFVMLLMFAARLSSAREPGTRRSGSRVALLRAAAPYLVLVLLILITRLVGPVEVALRSVVVEWSMLGAFRGSVQPLFHPGTALLVGFMAGALLQRASARDVSIAMSAAARQLVVVTIALVAMLGLARTMVHAGMIDVLASAAAAIAGSAWPALVPAVGALGTFVTGSATASNILLTDLQLATAGRLELSALPMLGGQGFGAAAGNIVCPHNVIAGGATVGLVGREGEVIRRTLLPCLIYVALGGLLLLILV